MHPETPTVNGPGPDKGLPPVSPPTGKFLVQLFLVPGVIVTLIVGFLIVLRWLFGGPGTPEEFLKALDDSNPEVRWRAASNLSQVLPRDKGLAADADFALKLADRLEKAIQAAKPAEEAFQKKLKNLSENDAEAERRKLEADRAFVQFLTASLGHFVVPAGVPLLEEIATGEGVGKEVAGELKVTAALRRNAVEALAKLGGNLSGFDALDGPQQEAILAQLTRASENPTLGPWARATLRFLEERRAGHPDAFGMDAAMEKCAEAEDPGLRESVAFALNFWQGTPEQNARIESILARLANDDGHGEELRAQLYDDERYFREKRRPETREVLKSPGLLVRYNANLALARRGSTKTKIPMLREMLDEQELGKAITLERADGTRHPNDAKVEMVLLNSLKALVELHQRRPEAITPELKQAVTKLTESPDKAVSAEAKQTLIALDRGQ
jgi:hypothetical protein